MVLSVRQKVRRRWLAFVEYITPDYWDLDPVHVAHRSLAAARERALQEEQTGQQQEEKFVRGSTCTADGEDGGEGGDGSCDKDVEAGVADEERASQEKQQQQVVLVRGRRSQMYTPHRANPLTLVAPYYGSMEGGTPEQERRNKSYDNLCTRIFLVMDEPNWNTAAHIYAVCMSLVVILSCFSYILGTISHFRYLPPTCRNPVCVPSPSTPCLQTICYPQPKPAIHRVEVLSMLLFSLDYFLRVFLVHGVPCPLVCPEDWARGLLPVKEPGKVRKTFAYVCQVMNLNDLAAILPFYIHFGADEMRTNLVLLRLVRLLRVMRVFKLGRYTEGHFIIYETFLASIPALVIMLFFMLVITVLFGALIFYAEEGRFQVTEQHPEGAYLRNAFLGGVEVSPFSNILMGCYWVVMTATTVGYGEVVPTSSVGRILACIVAYSGIVSIALPVTIIGKHFNDVYFACRDEKAKQAVEEAAAAKARTKIMEEFGNVIAPNEGEGGREGGRGMRGTHLQQQQQQRDGRRSSSNGWKGAAVGGEMGMIVGGGLRRKRSVGPPPASVVVALPDSLLVDADPDAAFDKAAAAAAAAAAPAESGQAGVWMERPPAGALDAAAAAPAAGGRGMGGGREGLRKRALTNVIREQLIRMDNTTKYLMARLEELEEDL